MDTKILDSFASDFEIGTIFTPYVWSKFAIQKYGLLDDWLLGKTILDPTMGEGALLEALIDVALENGHTLGNLPIKNLFGVELNSKFHANAIEKFKNKYSIDMTGCFYNNDILTLSKIKTDIIFGNPPWQNFVDLPPAYKAFTKKFFHKFNLIGNAKELLLGNSRIDIASLVIQKTVVDNMHNTGYAIFFIPLSILLNDGANKNFRLFQVGDTQYSLSSVYDFNTIEVFLGISTRYGIARFDRNTSQQYPIPYFRYENGNWNEYFASPAVKSNGALIIDNNIDKKNIIPKIIVPSYAKPRQGINTCGANSIFFFEEYIALGNGLCKVNSKYILPQKFIFPLITTKNFVDATKPNKWVLLPYNQDTGKPLANDELNQHTTLADYLRQFQDCLEKRKGTMLNAYIKRGLWWSLLGVGKYNFSKYKIVWEAYGKKVFRPRIFHGSWQANQSLQAFVPCNDLVTANKILADLCDQRVENYLLSSKMEGTMNWAQPGRISALFEFSDRQLSLFDSCQI